MSRTLPAVVIAIALAACGDDGFLPFDAPPMPPDALPLGPYDDPSDFDRTGCQPGSVAFTPPGILHGYAVFDD